MIPPVVANPADIEPYYSRSKVVKVVDKAIGIIMKRDIDHDAELRNAVILTAVITTIIISILAILVGYLLYDYYIPNYI